MAINKVVYGNNTLVDLTGDTVEASNLLEGETAHDKSGNPVTGTAKQGHEIENSAGTKLTQRDVMQVLDGLEAVDDSTNQKTKIKMNLPIVSSADWNAMTEQEKTAYKASHYRFGVEVPDTEGVINAEYMKLLWENPNTTQAFAAQTITLNSADYDFLLWITSDGSQIVRKGQSVRLSEAQTTSDSNTRNIFRNATYDSDTSYSVANGIKQNATSTRSQDNTRFIPIAIYGIKKNFQFKVNAIATDLSTRADHCMLSDNETSVEDRLAEIPRAKKISLTNININIATGNIFRSDNYTYDLGEDLTNKSVVVTPVGVGCWAIVNSISGTSITLTYFRSSSATNLSGSLSVIIADL